MTNIVVKKEGDKSKGICENCKGVVETTFKYRDVPFSDDSGVVKNLLANVCDTCDEVVSIPAQETPKIKDALEKINKK